MIKTQNKKIMIKEESGSLVAKLIGMLDYLFLFVLIVLTGSIWPRQEDAIMGLNVLRCLALILPLMIFALKTCLYPRNKIELAVYGCGIASIAMVIMLAIQGSSFNSVILVFAPILAFFPYAFSFTSKDDIKVSLNRFLNLALVIAVVSLFFFVFGSLLHFIKPSGVVQFEWDWMRTAASYWNLYYEPQITYMLGYEGVRNCAIFTEAPMYVFVLVLALTFEVFFLRISIIKTIILLLAVVSTLSTTGYVSVFLVFMLKFLFAVTKKPALQRIRLFIIPVLVITMVLAMLFFLNDKSSTGSYDVRTDHMVACWNIFLDYIPFGCGLGNTDIVHSYTQYDQGISVGIPYFLAETGFIGIILIFGPMLFAIIETKGEDKKIMIAMAIIMVWLLSSTNVHFNSMLEWLVFEVLFLRYPSFKDPKCETEQSSFELQKLEMSKQDSTSLGVGY